MKKWTRRIFLAVIVLFVLANVMAFFHARKFTHFDPGIAKAEDPSKVSWTAKLIVLLTGVSLPRPLNEIKPARPYQTIYLQSNVKIECWYLKGMSSRGTVILCHGYGGKKSDMLERAYVFSDAGYDALLPDFMGAGGSEGNVCTIGYNEAENVKTCIDYLDSNKAGPIYLFGTSMGAAAIMRACSREQFPVKGLILECPFASMRQAVKNRFEMVGVPAVPLADLLVFWGGTQHGFNAFAHNPEDYAQKIETPVLLLYGARDDRVKPFEIERIYENLKGPKTKIVYPQAGHESYLNQYREQWSRDVLGFLEKQPVSAVSLSGK